MHCAGGSDALMRLGLFERWLPIDFDVSEASVNCCERPQSPPSPRTMKSTVLFPAAFVATLFVPTFCQAADPLVSYRAPVPGAGRQIEFLGDTFEDEEWAFFHNHPKSSREEDGQARGPLGGSANRRLQEGPERGQPDLLETIATPPDGLAGSSRALLLRTLHSGVPGTYSRAVHQDDLICGITTRLGSQIPVQEIPSCVVRVWLPPASEWEDRSGPHFGIRLGVRTTTLEANRGFFASGTSAVVEPYWPGMWIHFRSETSRGVEADSALIKVRGDRRGIDFPVKDISAKQFGWWTFGMSLSADGQVHYFASPGVDELTAADHLTSQYPYGFRAEQLNSFFFNVCNLDDGHTWSTPFVIDDPSVYVVHSTRVEQLVDRREAYEQRRYRRRSAGRSRSVR
jgi:hypothetical protein